MEIFSVVMLVLLFIIIQHLMNWMWRKLCEEDTFLLALILSGLGLFISFIILRYIIIWGYPLFK